MQILGRQTGGPGVPLELGPVDTDHMRKQHAEQMLEVIKDVDFFNLPADLGGGIPYPAVINSSVRVTDGERDHTVGWSGEGDSPAVAELSRLLQLVQDSGVEWHVAEQV